MALPAPDRQGRYETGSYRNQRNGIPMLQRANERKR